jgi:predicted permease
MDSRPGWRRDRPRGADRRADIEEELRLHIDGRVEQYVANGMDEAKARKLALERFGDMRRIAAQCRHERSQAAARLPRTCNALMSGIFNDIRYAVRALTRRPGYTATIVITLVLAIGATTAVFSVVNGVLLHPLPHPDPEELALVWEVDQRPGFFRDRVPATVEHFIDWREHNRVFESMAAFQSYLVTFRGAGDPERVLAGNATANFFATLGVNATIGRTFVPEDDVAGADRVVLLGHTFWQTRFGGDPSVIGRSVDINNSTRTVVGVLPHGFELLDRDYAVWFPIMLAEQGLRYPHSHRLDVVSRMKPGVTVAMAQRDMERVFGNLREAYPEFLTGLDVNVESLTDHVVGRIRPALLLLTGAVLFVLLIASVNVANLMLTRTTVEHREIAIRTALGAGRGRVARQKLTESLVLAMTGGTLGVIAATGGTQLLLAVAPKNLPQVDHIGLDARVLGLAIVLSLVTGVLFGIAPALRAARADMAANLKEGSRSSTASRAHQRLRAGFTVTQLAFSLMLLISAGLMLTTFSRLMQVDPGFEASGVATMKVALPRAAYPTRTEQTVLYDRLLPTLQSLPGVQNVGATRMECPNRGPAAATGRGETGLRISRGDAGLFPHDGDHPYTRTIFQRLRPGRGSACGSRQRSLCASILPIRRGPARPAHVHHQPPR